MMAEAKICDLDEILLPKRIIKITGKVDKISREIDVTEIPARVILELIKRENDLKKKMNDPDDNIFDWMLDMAIDICKPSFAEMSKDWIIENMSFDQLQRFLQFVLQPVNDYIESAVEEAKKTMAQNEA